MIELVWPWMLILLPLPWLLPRRRTPVSMDEQAPLVPFYARISRIQQELGGVPAPSQNSRLRQFLMALAWLALVLAACRPQMIGEPIQLDVSGRDLMLAVDVSPSMQEQDMIWLGYQATRLHVVKEVVKDFVTKRQGDRIGVILFGTQPYVQVPLTFDLKTVNQLVDEAMLGIAGRATAIGDAVALAVKRLRERPEQSRVLILLTDGANTAGEIPPLKAAELAAAEHIKIYSIGIGAEEVMRPGIFGYRRENPSIDLDEAMLKEMAALTGGQYFRARSSSELEMVYEAVNLLEPVSQEQKFYRPVKPLFYWPLAIALGLSALLILGRAMPLDRVRRRLAGQPTEAES